MLETTRNNLLKILDLIDSTGIIRKLYAKEGIPGLSKPKKILFDNPNIIYAFGKQHIGTVRECFFASQITENHSLLMPTQGDFLVDDNLIFEVGGHGKGYKQIRDLENSYVAADDIEIGHGARIALWLFGMMY